MITIKIITKKGIKQWEEPPIDISDNIGCLEYPGVKRVYFMNGDENLPEYLTYKKTMNEYNDSQKKASEIDIDSLSDEALDRLAAKLKTRLNK